MNELNEEEVKRLIEEEREACAKIVDPLPHEQVSRRTLETRAELIRARGQA